eukprot:6148668-Pleurochrysis_carterae.AAC.1
MHVHGSKTCLDLQHGKRYIDKGINKRKDFQEFQDQLTMNRKIAKRSRLWRKVRCEQKYRNCT